MLRLFLSGAFLLLAHQIGSAEESGRAERLRARVFFIPPGFQGTSGATTPVSDARAYLKSCGIEIPPEGEATYDLEYHTLTIRASKEAIEKVNALVEDQLGPLTTLQMEFELVEFSVAPHVERGGATYERLRELAGGSWRVIDRVVLEGKPGNRVAGRFVTRMGKDGAKTSGTPEELSKIEAEDGEDDFRPGEIGSIVEADSVSLRNNVDLSFDYHHRSPARGEFGPTDFKAATSISLRMNSPAVAQSMTVPADASALRTKELALIARVSMVAQPRAAATSERKPSGAPPTKKK